MTAERIIAKTSIDESVTVVTMEAVRSGMIVGVHPSLHTKVIGVDGIDGCEPYRQYINQHAARIGHDIVFDEITRLLIEQRAMACGINSALVGGAL